MAFTFATSTREVLEQVVREPRFRAVSTPPLISLHQFGLIALVYAAFGLSTWAWMAGYLHWLPMMVINSVFIYIIFTPLHDATHRSVSSNRKLNDVLGNIAAFIMIPGLTTQFYRYLHLEHHRHTGNKILDPDEVFVASRGLQRFTAFFAPDFTWLYWFFKRWSERPKSVRREVMVVLTVYVIVHAVGLLGPYAFEFFLAWMIPSRLGFALVIWLFASIQHPEGVRWEDAPFQTTVEVKVSTFGKYFMLGQSVHCLHHLAPNVPFYRYHEAWRLGEQLFRSQNIPNRTIWSECTDIKLPKPATQQWLNAKLERVSVVGADIQSYEFVPADGSDWPAFDAGAHIDVRISDKLVRQYSLCNDPSERNRYVIAVKKDVHGRGGSKLLHESMRPGDAVEIGSPRNNFALNLDFQQYVLIAGGIGITPLLSMAHRLWAAGKPFELHICARDQAAQPFADALSEIPFSDAVHVYLDNADIQQRFDAGQILGQYKRNTALYICGPGGFMSSVMQTGEQQGWPQTAMFSETFAPPKIDATENKSFEVFLARSKKTLQVRPDEFLIDVLHGNGHQVMCSCTQGICGSCITPVLEGVPDHRDAVMSDAERNSNKQMCVCVSRAKSARLVLDI